MKNILKAKPLSPSYISKIDEYFKAKSNLFDTFDEIFLHIGFILDGTNRSPNELVELAVEDIIFASQEELQKHVSEYFYFHNSIVKFLDIIENAKDGDELLKKAKKIAKALFRLCDSKNDIFQQRIAEEALEIVEIVMQNYNISASHTDENLEKTLYAVFDNASAAGTLATVIYAIPYLQNMEYGKKDSISIASTLLLSCMILNYLKKERFMQSDTVGKDKTE